MSKLNKFIEKIVKTDKFLDKQTPIFLLLILVLLLRIPNLFEPYWYGDEGIYLTIGQSLNKGARLYSEIIDHKTPLIYYLARVHTQLNFRLLNIAWMLLTTTAFYYLAKKLLNSVKLTTFATFIFVILTTLPWLEGNIPNGELFVLGFMIWGGWILSKTSYFKNFLEGDNWTGKNEDKAAGATTGVIKTIRKDAIALITAGVFFGLGILTKVPAVLDLAVFLSIGYFTFTNNFSLKNWPKNFKILGKKVAELSLIALGVILPILGSIFYFISVGSGQDYLDFGLLYNFRYASSWQLPFSSELLQFAFTLPGKFLIATTIILLLTFLKKYFKPSAQLIISWFGLALFASLLSNRPYPHYFIQLVPALALILTLILKNKYEIVTNFAKPKGKQNAANYINLILESLVILIFIATMFLLNFAPYSTTKYYKNWYRLVTNQISNQEYNQSFDYLMTDNYKAAEIIGYHGSSDLFIWGTNPMLYALTQAQPTGRFTVSFHIKDFDAFDETARDFIEKSPQFVVVMNNEDHEFEEFTNYLNEKYLPYETEFDHFVLWKKNVVN